MAMTLEVVKGHTSESLIDALAREHAVACLQGNHRKAQKIAAKIERIRAWQESDMPHDPDSCGNDYL